MSEWREFALSDVADVSWGDTKTTKASYIDVGYRAFSATGPDGFLDHFDYNEPGVVLSAIGAQAGKTWFASGKWSCIKNTIRILAQPGCSDARFLYYLTRKPGTFSLRGSAQSFVAQKDARSTKVWLPPLPEQRRIAGVLGALDDLIDTNERLAQQMEAYLEAQFVLDGFNCAGDSVLEEFVTVNPRYERPTDEAAFVEMSSLPTEGFHISEMGTRLKPSGPRFTNGDSLLARITPSLENGKAALVTSLEKDEIAVGSTEFLVLQPRNKTPKFWPYLVIRSSRFRSYAIKHMSGTSGRQRFDAASARQYPIQSPNQSALKSFGVLEEALFPTMIKNYGENQLLRRIRDELLPLLMSGRIRVREAEEVVQEVAG